MEKSKIDETVRLSRLINSMDKETFLLMCKQLSDERKSEMEYQCFLNNACSKLNDEIMQNKITLAEIEKQLNSIISITYELGNEDDILYRISGYANKVKKIIREGTEND